MGDSTWTGAGISGEYNDPNNWTSGVPGPNDTGFFGMPTNTNINIFIESPVLAGAWHFLSGASQYNFITALNPSFGVLIFTTGVTIDGGSAHFFNYANIEFTGNSSSGVAIFDKMVERLTVTSNDPAASGSGVNLRQPCRSSTIC